MSDEPTEIYGVVNMSAEYERSVRLEQLAAARRRAVARERRIAELAAAARRAVDERQR